MHDHQISKMQPSSFSHGAIISGESRTAMRCDKRSIHASEKANLLRLAPEADGAAFVSTGVVAAVLIATGWRRWLHRTRSLLTGATAVCDKPHTNRVSQPRQGDVVRAPQSMEPHAPLSFLGQCWQSKGANNRWNGE